MCSIGETWLACVPRWVGEAVSVWAFVPTAATRQCKGSPYAASAPPAWHWHGIRRMHHQSGARAAAGQGGSEGLGARAGTVCRGGCCPAVVFPFESDGSGAAGVWAAACIQPRTGVCSASGEWASFLLFCSSPPACAAPQSAPCPPLPRLFRRRWPTTCGWRPPCSAWMRGCQRAPRWPLASSGCGSATCTFGPTGGRRGRALPGSCTGERCWCCTVQGLAGVCSPAKHASGAGDPHASAGHASFSLCSACERSG